MRLAIDTSGVDQALVVFTGNRVLAADDWVRSRDDPPVMARLQDLMTRAGAMPADLEAVAAARGPGSFTGLRVGLSLAAGVAYARSIPLYAIDSMAIVARRSQTKPAAIALRDAGRGELFAWREQQDAVRIRLDELAEWLPPEGRILAEPSGALTSWLPNLAAREIAQSERRPLSIALMETAIWTFESSKPLRYDEVQALYVQPAAAEERRRKAT
jgi:tRNA threonylcarbamoyl adenosine modification protein YeaZ